MMVIMQVNAYSLQVSDSDSGGENIGMEPENNTSNASPADLAWSEHPHEEVATGVADRSPPVRETAHSIASGGLTGETVNTANGESCAELVLPKDESPNSNGGPQSNTRSSALPTGMPHFNSHPSPCSLPFLISLAPFS
jgi:hypothetical protein